MHDRLVQADNQICFRALCGMQQERDQADGRRAGIIALAMKAMRKASSRRQACIDCPYGGKCATPEAGNLLRADKVDAHVSIRPIMTGSATR
ncbi:MAG: hypothetical protein JJ920_18445 [Roseitalea sp.]|jgi:hypothetical protein|nr:hypothetical protein [Roseitalea sp.]MBO6722174.1 hypothetical protein [Roseitalea sp.]MBO6744898.1 hypothetical protein [Roseitalea sp.]